MSTTVTNPGPILGHVRAIRAAHFRLVGKELCYEAAIERLDRFNAMQDDPSFPLRMTEVVIGAFLVGEFYSPEAIRRILAHVAIYGRGAGSTDLDVEDAEAVDALLPRRSTADRELAEQASAWGITA